MKKTLLIILLSLSRIGYASEPSDSTVLRQSLFIIPHASYQQETSVAPGIAYGYYSKSNNISKISSVSGSVVYTFRNQFLFNITPKIYFNADKWYLYSNLSLRNYPDFYYGIGNKLTSTKQPYTSQNISFLIQPQYIVSKHFYVGVSFSSRYDRIVSDTSFEFVKRDIFSKFGHDGWTPFTQTNIGLVAAYDNRDNQFYPQNGFFAKAAYSSSKKGMGSTFSLQEVTFDFRHYIPIFASHVLAWQAYYAGVFGQNGIPFQLLPTVGGIDKLRGFRQGMYRENVLMLLQTEYRLPIYKRLKGAVFCSLGDVMNSSNYKIDKLKVAYGAGLRYRLNDARVHLRLDAAKNNYGDKLQFYITATEAF